MALKRLCIGLAGLLVCFGASCAAPKPLLVFSNLIYSDTQLLLEDTGEDFVVEIFASPTALEYALDGGNPDIIILSGLENIHEVRNGGHMAAHGISLRDFPAATALGDFFSLGATPYVWLYDGARLPSPPETYFSLDKYSHLGIAMVDPIYDPYYHAAAYLFAGEEEFIRLWQGIAAGDLYFCDSAHTAARRVVEGQSALALTTYGEAVEAMAQKSGLDYSLTDQKSGLLGVRVQSYACILGSRSEQPERAKAVLSALAFGGSEQVMIGAGICPFGLRTQEPVQALPFDSAEIEGIIQDYNFALLPILQP